MKQAVFFILFSFVIYISVFAQNAETERKYFEEAYQEINAMLTDQKPVSFKRAVFLSENAYLNNTLSYSAFDLAIKSTAFYIQQTAENLKLKHPKEKPLSVNYAIFQYITDTTYRVRGDKIYRFLPYRYDFSDFNGQKDWRKMFVTKLLEEGTGNCRSLPYFYKLLADECKVEANLALAPNHIYIKHRDVGKREEGWLRRMYNVELTNGSFPMDGWIVASGYITLDGIRNALFMDTLSAKQSVGLCLLDLAKGYERKFGVKGVFVAKCVEAVLKVQPFNINALLLKAELLKEQYDKNKTPANFQLLETHCGNLVKWGYREMPIEMYLNWLFEIRAKSNSFDSVHYKPKKFDTQKYNPMKDDKKLNIKMHTLTDGRFDEFPEHAETTYVGSAVYDIYNKKIVGFIKRDTLYSETLLEPDVVSRWLSLDPIVHPYESPYTAFANNPVYFIDPNGTTVGDYHNTSGNKIGTDGINDKKNYMVTDQTEISNIERLTENGLNVVQDYAKSAIELPSHNSRDQMGKSINKTLSPTTGRADIPEIFQDPDGGFHEEAGFVGLNENNVEEVAHFKGGQRLKPGATALPANDIPLDPVRASKLKVLYTYHTHPKSGMYTYEGANGNFFQDFLGIDDMGYGAGPSVGDIESHQSKLSSGRVMINMSIVFETSNNKTYIYNDKGVIGIFPTDKFLNMPNDH